MSKAQQIEAEMLEVARDVAGADIRMRGPIRLTVPPPVAKYLLLPHLVRFRADYPEIDLEIVATYGFSDLGRRDADVAIRFSEAPDEHLVGRRLPVFKDSIYASPAYIRNVSSDDNGKNAVWIGWPQAARFSNRIAATHFAHNPVAWRLPGLELQAEAARQGLGIALLPCIMGDTDPLLVRVPNAQTYDTLPAWLLTHPDLRRMERVRIFAQTMFEAMTKEANKISGQQG